MKKIVKEVPTIKTVTTYEASDGKVFLNEDDCKKWEESYECTITNCFKKIPQIKIESGEAYMGGDQCDDNIIAIYPRSFEDIKIINAYTKVITGGLDSTKLTQEHIGHTLLLNFGYEMEWCYWRDMNKHLAHIKEVYESYESKLTELMTAND